MKKPTRQTYIDLDALILRFNFPNELDRIREIARQTFENLEENIDRPYELHGGTRATRNHFGTDLPRGQRDEALLRHHLVGELFRIWEIGHGQVPVINNKNKPVQPFVVFVEHIFDLLDIGKVDQHLESFQSYRKEQFKQSGL